MIRVACSHPNIIYVTVSDMMGGQQLYVGVMPDILDTINWVHQYKQQLEREQQIRANDPVAQELFTQYETYLNIAYNK
jgi:hypothetical protein